MPTREPIARMSDNTRNAVAPNHRSGEAPKKRLKIMLAIDGLGLGGAEMVVRDLAHGLDRDQFDVCICCTKGVGGPVGQELIREGFDLFVLPGQREGHADYLTALKFRRAIKDRRVDIVHTHAASALLDAGLTRLTMPRLRVVHTFHFGNYPYQVWRHHVMESLCARAVDELIAVGWEQRRRIQEAYGLPDSRIRVIWNGVASAQPAPDQSFRTDVGSGDRLLIGTIAKLIEQKGLDDLLAVARRCREACYPVQFVIVGDGPLRPVLEQRRRELGLEDTVVITGWIANAAVQALPAFDVFFQSSRWEAMSIAVLEAMAAGKAIVATRVGDNQHMIEHGVNGLLVQSGDVDSMVEALVRVFDRETRGRLGRMAHIAYEQQFTLAKMIQGYENVYRELVAR
jgi:glycosyltransferase involved in cell wall biosynthesis